MKPHHTTSRGVIYKARAQDVYPHLPDRSCSLIIWDGPYNMRKAAWDKFASWDAFRAWYRPHLEALDRIACEAASLYVWGNDESASQLRGMIADAGWERQVRVTWDKSPIASAMAWRTMDRWPDATEVCDVWSRGAGVPFSMSGPGCNVWRKPAAGLKSERLRTGRMIRAARKPNGGGSGLAREPLHPCQKPRQFWSRIIRASSRPGDTVLEPFGGTCRAAFACLDLPEDQARRYVCIEPDEDGRDYLGAVTKALRERQPTLWGAT